MRLDEFDKLSNRDILFVLHTDVCWLKKIVGNHLKHHSGIIIALVGIIAALGAVILKYIIFGRGG